MAEWFKAHAWKACVGNTTVGSNPTLSASLISRNFRAGAYLREIGLRLQVQHFTIYFSLAALRDRRNLHLKASLCVSKRQW